jgi:hypothetical protein
MPSHARRAAFLVADTGPAGVLIGGVTATLHGSPLNTRDTDVCPARDPDNLVRLAAALRDLDARIRTADAPAGLPFACDEHFLAGVSLLNLVTRFGDLHLTLQPSGTGGDDDLAAQGLLSIRALWMKAHGYA